MRNHFQGLGFGYKTHPILTIDQYEHSFTWVLEDSEGERNSMKTNILRIKQSYWIGKAIWGEKKWVDLVRIHKEMRENSRSSTYRLIQNFLVCHFLCMGVDMLHILGTLAE